MPCREKVVVVKEPEPQVAVESVPEVETITQGEPTAPRDSMRTWLEVARKTTVSPLFLHWSSVPMPVCANTKLLTKTIAKTIINEIPKIFKYVFMCIDFLIYLNSLFLFWQPRFPMREVKAPLKAPILIFHSLFATVL